MTMPLARVSWHVIKRLPPPLLAASAAAWTVLALQHASSEQPAICFGAGHAIGSGPAAVFAPDRLAALAGSWLLMLVAMMAPLLQHPLLHIWQRSLARRRLSAVALFLLGYVMIWSVAGAVLAVIAARLAGTQPAGGWAAFAGALAIALLWQISPAKQVCLNRCHRQLALAAFGRRADLDALQYGLVHGVWCVGACWALMLLPLVAGSWHLPAMAVITVVLIAERTRAPQRPHWRLPGLRLPGLRIPQWTAHIRSPAPERLP